VNRIDFIVPRAEIIADYAPGSVETVRQHDGSIIKLAKLRNDYNPHDRAGAMAFCQAHAAKGEVVTGLLYIEEDAQDLHAHLNTAVTPLNKLAESDLCPGSKALDTLNASYR
jgi:2-oxoglutarate ferredoxin oxidoreductase subunit beta